MGDNDPNIAKKKQVVEQQSYLSDDLIFEEILTRLPVESVLRFKSVSKQWYSTLSSSDFTNAHLLKSPLSHPSAPVNTLFIMDLKNCYLFSYDDDNDQISGNFKDNLVKLDLDFDIQEDYLELTGSCNGLISLGSMSNSNPASNEYFIIWNPATRKLCKYASYGYLEHFNNEHYFFVAPGFGYVSSIDDYKYVRILTVLWEIEGGDYDGTSNIVHIFSLKENKWRKIDFDFDHDHIVPYGRAVLINEKLYWGARSGGDSKLVVSFDLGLERFDIINFNLDRFDDLGVMGGCLSKCNCDKTFTGDKSMHILKPPSIVKSIGVPKGLRLDTKSEMIGFTRTGKFFVTGPFNDEPWDFKIRTLGIVDTRTKPMQYTMLLRFDHFFKMARYVPSLVSPIPIEEPSEA
ncbi:F-box protein CPR1-like [Silene latifolia]|uniref:F-box protein CPR1-like n=1 Tax=Silene latifolia TaxID=37657 RepID=UPI003D7825EF